MTEEQRQARIDELLKQAKEIAKELKDLGYDTSISTEDFVSYMFENPDKF